MKGRLKLVIAFMLLIILIIIILTSCIIMLNKDNIDDGMINKELEVSENSDFTLTTNTSYELLDNINLYYTLNTSVSRYFRYLVEQNNVAVYSLLNENYIKDNNINKDNVLNKLSNINEFQEFWVEKVYSKQIEFDKETQYCIKGSILTKNYQSKEDIYIIANFDFENNTFSITPCDDVDLNITSFENIINSLMQEDNGGQISVSETIGKGSTINKNQYNDFYILNIEEESILKEYIRRYKINNTYYIEDAYNCLDKQKRAETFNSIDEYKNYIEYNSAEIQKYRIDKFDSYTQYTAVNKNNKKIIFIESSPMQFTIIIEK